MNPITFNRTDAQKVIDNVNDSLQIIGVKILAATLPNYPAQPLIPEANDTSLQQNQILIIVESHIN